MGRAYYGDAPLYYGDERLFYGEPYHSPGNLSATLEDAVFAGTASNKIRASMSAVLDDVQPLAAGDVVVGAGLAGTLDDAVLVATVLISKGFSYTPPVCMTITDASTTMTITALECALCD